MSLLNKQISELFPNKKIFAFYVSYAYVIPDEWMVEIGLRLQKMGFAAIALVHHDVKDIMNFNALGNIFYVTREEIKYLTSINCFVVTDLEFHTKYPETSKVLAIVHASDYNHNCASFLHSASTVGAFDALCVGFPFFRYKDEIKKLWDNFPPSFKHQRSPSDFYLIGCGYPKLNLMRHKILNKQKELKILDTNYTKALCYAPVDLNWAHHIGGNRVERYASRIIRTLINNFPEHKIIFRPAPINFNEKLVSLIENCFQNNNFVVDRNTSYIDTFAQSDIVITDFSHIASTFSTLTGRHAIYFRPWENFNISYAPLQYTVSSFKNLVEVIKNILKDKHKFNFNEFAEYKGYLPFDNAIENFINILFALLEEKPMSGWLAIERKNKMGRGKPLQEIMLAILSEDRSAQIEHSVFYADYFKSPLLAIFAIHLHKIRVPDQSIPDNIIELIKIDTSTYRTYGDFSLHEIAKMYLDYYFQYENDIKNNISQIDLKLQKAFFMQFANAALKEHSI